MNYAEIKYADIANGPGTRISLFVSGCTNHCEGCFNPETWDFQYGELFDADTEDQILRQMEPYFIEGLSLLGGEPFEPENSAILAEFTEKVKRRYPEKTIWCYSGCTLGELLYGSKSVYPQTYRLLSTVDVLVDGPFMEDQKVLNLKFRGSTNQRLIDVPASLAARKVVEWVDPAEAILANMKDG